MIRRLALAAVIGAALLAFNCALPPASVNEQGGGGGGGSGGGPSGGGSGGGSGLTCGVAFDPSAPLCEACAETYCCSQLQACSPGTTCYDLANCLVTYCTGSQDPNCANTYCSAFAAGMEAGQALVDCVCTVNCPDCAASCST